MQPTGQDEGLAPAPVDDDSRAPVHEPEVPPPLEDDRDADLLEAESVKYNVARIVRLSSGCFALLTHYRARALDIIKVGTIETSEDQLQCNGLIIVQRNRAKNAGSAINHRWLEFQSEVLKEQLPLFKEEQLN